MTVEAEVDAISPLCDMGKHDECQSTDCACVCHIDEELDELEDSEDA